jgi:hypothetical protein
MGAPGFDDAAIERPQLASRATRTLTVVYPYYENPQFLRQQLEGWYAWPADVRCLVRVIVVDDGSPKAPAEPVMRDWLATLGADRQVPGFGLELFRIEVDVRWNWLAARNIGMKESGTGWCLLTDMDHVIPRDTIEVITRAVLDPHRIYTFRRREHTGEEIHRHPNSMLLTRELFWKIGGYDEALSGHYGTDGDWRRRCAAAGTVKCLDAYLERHEYQADSSTTDYLRKQPQDAGKKKIIATRRAGWRPRTLSFPFHRVHL